MYKKHFLWIIHCQGAHTADIMFLLCFKVVRISYSAAHVSVLGQTFQPGVVVCLKAPSDVDFPEFGEVTQVLVPDESKLLLVKKLHTECYSELYNAYSVNKSQNYALTSIGELAIHDVYHLYRSSSELFVVVRSCNHVEMST